MTKFSYIEQERPVLSAAMHGTEGYQSVKGEVCIYQLEHGLCLSASFTGLPPSQSLPFHIHEGYSCEKAGDKLHVFPDVMSDRFGEAYARYYFDKLTASEISGRVVMLHVKLDGKEPPIACGILKRVL